MAFIDLLIDVCNVLRYTDSGADGYGQPTKAWANHITGAACRFTMPSNREVQTNLEVVLADGVLFLDGEVDVTERDRILLNGTTTYEILSVTHYHGLEPDVHTELMLRTVR